jgi:hypothetical protein
VFISGFPVRIVIEFVVTFTQVIFAARREFPFFSSEVLKLEHKKAATTRGFQVVFAFLNWSGAKDI